MSTQAKTKTIHRDSINARFVTSKEAARRPATTEKQRLRSAAAVKPPAGARKKGGVR